MATRAEQFRSRQERESARAHAKESLKTNGKAASRKSRPQAHAELLNHDLSGTVRPEGPSSALRNISKGKRASYALEDSAGKAPSRKSTRRSSGEHLKAATALTSRQKLRRSTPASRHSGRT